MGGGEGGEVGGGGEGLLGGVVNRDVEGVAVRR